MKYLVFTKYQYPGEKVGVEIVTKTTERAAKRLVDEEVKWENTIESFVVDSRAIIIYTRSSEF